MSGRFRTPKAPSAAAGAVLVTILVMGAFGASGAIGARPAEQDPVDVGPAAAAASPVETLIDRAYERAFNLAHDDAIALAREAVAAAPDDSRAHRALASLLWQKALFLRGAVTIDHYMSGMSEAQEHLPDPPAALEQEFRAALARATELA